MKKIAILTLYDSFNFGTFLQAYALSQFLAQQGYDIYFIENAKKNRFIKWVKNKDIKKMVFNIGQAYRYYKAQKYFRIKSPDETFDAIVIGSDEIWNIKNPSFSHHKRYFGYGLNAKKIIAYAPSVNNTNADDLRKYYNNDINLDNFSNLSVRDKSTAKFLDDLGYTNYNSVLDPTFLIDTYDKVIIKPKFENYILIYGYNFKEDQKKKIKEFAKKQGKKLLSIGLYQSWCDLNVKANPFEFLGYMKYADKIITSTFHGTVFSIILNKSFASFSNGKRKIEELLGLFELSNRDALERNLEEIFEEKIDYQKINNKIKEERKNSINYLKDALKGI